MDSELSSPGPRTFQGNTRKPCDITNHLRITFNENDFSLKQFTSYRIMTFLLCADKKEVYPIKSMIIEVTL